MKVFLNPGHAPNGNPDPGACGNGLRECDIAKEVANLVEKYLVAAGVEVVENLQSDNLYHDGEGPCVVEEANDSGADIFVSIHCNSATPAALGTETLCYADRGDAGQLAHCIQARIIGSLGTVDRGVKERPGLVVLRLTDMPAVLVELAFISNEGDAALLANDKDEFARAIARGITDYECM